jgi:hypothetical protein
VLFRSALCESLKCELSARVSLCESLCRSISPSLRLGRFSCSSDLLPPSPYIYIYIYIYILYHLIQGSNARAHTERIGGNTESGAQRTGCIILYNTYNALHPPYPPTHFVDKSGVFCPANMARHRPSFLPPPACPTTLLLELPHSSRKYIYIYTHICTTRLLELPPSSRKSARDPETKLIHIYR